MINDYKKYKMNHKEWIICMLKYLVVLLGISYLFFDNLYMIILLCPLLIFYVKQEISDKERKRLKRLNLEYKEMIMSVASALHAGYSVENAFKNALNDMQLIYPEGSYIETELRVIVRGLDNNISIEDLIMDFAQRSGLEDIYNFGQVLKIAKRNGGNLVKIITNTAENISQKIEISQEIDTAIAAKKLEQTIMGIMPFAIVLYIRVSNQVYISALYHNLIGIVVMLVSLLLTVGTNFWAKKLIQIEV